MYYPSPNLRKLSTDKQIRICAVPDCQLTTGVLCMVIRNGTSECQRVIADRTWPLQGTIHTTSNVRFTACSLAGERIERYIG